MKHIIHSLIIFVFLVPGNIFATVKMQQHTMQHAQGEKITSSQVTTYSISGKGTQQINGKAIVNIKVDLYDGN